jgi:plastocyanin
MHFRSALLPGLAAIAVAMVAAACGHSSPSMSSMSSMPSTSSTSSMHSTSSKASASTVVAGKAARLRIANYSFVPARMTVKVGTTITVTNVDSTAHTVTARSGAFDTGTVNPGKSKSFMVAKPGVYAYYCQFHAFMNGTLTVVK